MMQNCSAKIDDEKGGPLVKVFQKALALILSAGMVFGASVPAMAADTAITADSGAQALYPNGKEAYVSIDLKESNPKSDWFAIQTEGLELKRETPTIKSVLKDKGAGNMETDTLLAESLHMAPLEDSDATNWLRTQFLVKSGKTPAVGIYYVTLNVPMLPAGTVDTSAPAVYGEVSVELHINSGDPSYIKGDEIRFDMKFDGQIKTLVSQPIQIFNPASTNVTAVKNGSFYSDAACTVKYDEMSVVEATNSSFKLQIAPTGNTLKVPGKVYFKMQTAARMVVTPVYMTIGVYATNPDDVFPLVYTENLVASDDTKRYTRVSVRQTNGELVSVDQITLLDSTFANGDVPTVESQGGNLGIVASKACAGQFNAEYNQGVIATYSNGVKYEIAQTVLQYKNKPISATGTYDWKLASVKAKTSHIIDLNRLDTYTVGVKVYGFNSKKEAVTPTSIQLAGSDPGYFEIVPGSIKTNETDKCIELNLQLLNQTRELRSVSIPVTFGITVDGTVGQLDVIVSATADQPVFYLSNAGSDVSLDEQTVSMSLNSTKKFDLHIKNYKLIDNYRNRVGVMIGDYEEDGHNNPFTIVRGNALYVPASGETIETITVRYDSPLGPNDSAVELAAWGEFKPQISNSDVKLTLKANSEDLIYTSLFITPYTGGSGGGGGGGGSSSGGGGPSGLVGIGGVSSTGSGSISAAQATTAVNKAINEAKASGSKTANVKFTNVSAISASAINTIVNAANKAGVTPLLTADTRIGNVVTARISIDLSKLASAADIKLGVALNNKAVTDLFTQHFSNQVQVVSFTQKGAFGATANVAVKVDLTKLNAKALKFYTYDAATNTYAEIKVPAYFVDSNGYVHFSTTVGNHIIITDKALTKK